MLEYFKLWDLFVAIPPIMRIVFGVLWIFMFVSFLLGRFSPKYRRKLFWGNHKKRAFTWDLHILPLALVVFMWWQAIYETWNWREPFFGHWSWWVGTGGSVVAALLGLIPAVLLFFKTEKIFDEARRLKPDAPFRTKPGFWAAVYLIVLVLMVPFGMMGGIWLKDWLVRLF